MPELTRGEEGAKLAEAIACCLARQDGWQDPYALYTESIQRITRGDLGDPIWWDYRESAEAIVAGPIADFQARVTAAESEIARLTAEVARVEAERDGTRQTNRDLHRRAQKAEAFKQRHRNGFQYVFARRVEDRRARRAAEASASALRERVAVLEKALRPFADIADNELVMTNYGTTVRHAPDEYSACGLMIKVGDLRAARAALKESSDA